MCLLACVMLGFNLKHKNKMSLDKRRVHGQEIRTQNRKQNKTKGHLETNKVAEMKNKK